MSGEMVEREVIPCTIKYELGYLYLIAFIRTSNKQYPSYFRLDRIHSFSVVRSQRIDDMQRVAEYMKRYSKGITQMYGGEFIEFVILCKKDFYPYVHDKFRDAVIIEENFDSLTVKINAFSDGFIKWIISQPPEFIRIVQPPELIRKLAKTARKIIKIYKEDEQSGKKD